MLLKRPGFPQDEETVLCTVTQVQYHSVFCTLDEFDGKSGMINISEVAPGRIRNIREFVSEGKKVVCKVLGVDTVSNRIDLSLRRVSEIQKRQKLDQIRREQQAEKILTYFAEQQKTPVAQLYRDIRASTLFDAKNAEHYEYLADVFDDVVNKGLDLSKSLKATIATSLAELIKVRIRPPEVEIEGTLKLQSYDPNGVELVKNGIGAMTTEVPETKIMYLGGGQFMVKLSAPDYRIAERKLKAASDSVLAFAKKHKMEAEFIRDRQ